MRTGLIGSVRPNFVKIAPLEAALKQAAKFSMYAIGPRLHRSVFATASHRTLRTKGPFKLVNAAAKTWQRLKGENQLPKIVQGVKFQKGHHVVIMPNHHAA
jgi:hypothetical protein